MRALILFLAALLLLLQIVKGLSLEAALYPQIAFLFSYADGPVRRGLIPSLFHVAGIIDIGRALAWLHFTQIAILVAMVWVEMSRSRLAWLLAASALLPVMAAVNGYFDPFLIIGTMCVAALLRRQRPWLALLVTGTMILQHEIIIFLTLPLFLLELWLSPLTRRRTAAVVAVLLLFLGSFLAITAQQQQRLAPVAEARCVAERPNDHVLATRIWDKFCVRHMEATVGSDFTPMRVIVLPFYTLAYGIFWITLLMLAIVTARRHPGQLGGLLFFMAMPMALITMASDADRVMVLTSVPAWLIFERWAQVRSAAVQLPVKVVALLVLVQLPLIYPAVDVYAAYRALSPKVAERVFINTRSWALVLVNHYGLSTPPFLDVSACLDPRCRNLPPE